jgi:P-type E1-E2 ATPase
VEKAAARKAPIVILADRLSGIFVVVVLLLAAATIALWGVEQGLPHAIALLIVTCPCALGLATPLAANVALGRAARHGALIKGMQYLEALSKPGLIVFDKTGTLTTGGLAVADYEGDTELTALVRAAEQRSSHPIAKALLRDLPLSAALPVSEAKEVPGLGVSAKVDGKHVVVGSARLAELHCSLDRSSPRSCELLARNLSPVYVVIDGTLRACIGIGDTLRADARDCLTELLARGYELAILSGDRQEVVDHVVQQLGVPFRDRAGRHSCR